MIARGFLAFVRRVTFAEDAPVNRHPAMEVPMRIARSLIRLSVPGMLALGSACRSTATVPVQPAPMPIPPPSDVTPSMIREPVQHAVIPVPASAWLPGGPRFIIDSATSVVIRFAGAGFPTADDRTAVERTGAAITRMLGGTARPAPRVLGAADSVPARSILLVLDPARAERGDESYELAAAAAGVRITAARPAGLFYGMQTLRQLMPVSVEHPAALRRGLGVPESHVVDEPRYAWRGAMLDVSRHFLPVEDVKRFIDAMALYKFNRLHLHLSDDQGWRIEIAAWPNLTAHGGSTQVGGGRGGFYTQAQLRDLVDYARERHIEIVPEIDVPGHTNAALASYPELNCDGVAPPLYTGTRVGFSALCVTRDETYRFLADVVREIGAITGPWFHIGGDEVERLTHPQYLQFIERMQAIVTAAGKTMIGWGEVAPAQLQPATIVQHWKRDSSFVHAARGGRIILSPSPRAYLDMKYDSSTVLGLQWAARIEVRDAYDWDPATWLPNVPTGAILGVEAPIWSETLEKRSDFEFLAFPRLAAIAEIGWSPQDQRGWESFRVRLGAHGPRLAALGVNFYRSPQIPWER